MKHLLNKRVRENRTWAGRQDASGRNPAEDRNYMLYVLMTMSSTTQF